MKKPIKSKLDAYKKAGYSHYVFYKEYNDLIEGWVGVGFPVTKDSLENTKEELEKYSTFKDYEVTEL